MRRNTVLVVTIEDGTIASLFELIPLRISIFSVVLFLFYFSPLSLLSFVSGLVLRHAAGSDLALCQRPKQLTIESPQFRHLAKRTSFCISCFNKFKPSSEGVLNYR